MPHSVVIVNTGGEICSLRETAMLMMKDMSTGELEPSDEYEEEALSSGWNPAIADLIHREVDRYEITQAENLIPSDLADVDVNDFLEKMYSYID